MHLQAGFTTSVPITEILRFSANKNFYFHTASNTNSDRISSNWASFDSRNENRLSRMSSQVVWETMLLSTFLLSYKF